LGRGRTDADPTAARGRRAREPQDPRHRRPAARLLSRDTGRRADNARTRYEGIILIHVRPALGRLPLSKLDSDLLDRFFGQLRPCRERCNGRTRHVRHRMQREHECDGQCAVVLVPAPIGVLRASDPLGARHRPLGCGPLALDRPQPARGQVPASPTGEQPLAAIGARGLPPARGSFGTDRSSGWRPRSARARSASAWYTGTRP
jgi:hypothetical protein